MIMIITIIIDKGIYAFYAAIKKAFASFSFI